MSAEGARAFHGPARRRPSRRAPSTTQQPADDVLLRKPLLILWLVTGATFLICLVLTLVLIYSIAIVGNVYVLPRLYVALLILTYVVFTLVMIARGRERLASRMILGFYLVLAALVTLVWGITLPVGLLLFGFVIMLAGVTLGARAILPVTAIVLVILTVAQTLTELGITEPDFASLSIPSTFMDVVAFGSVFVIFAVVSWLSGRRMELSLAQAQAAEAALQKEKESLADRLEDKTRELREAHLEEMRSLYRFAELGQLGTVLLHDLANNLTALTLDIDDIERQNQRSESVTRARESISYLEGVVSGVRSRIRAEGDPQVFDAMFAVFESVTELGPKARRAGILLQYERLSKKPFPIKGDPLRLAHILTILITNAIEAYGTTKEGDDTPSVIISASAEAKTLTINVTDHGKGIRPRQRERLFQPFSSTKPNGMGIGLFMAKEMTERHFKGTLVLSPRTTETTFTLTLNAHRNKK